MGALFSETQHTARALARRPLYSGAMIATIALAIGASTVFAMLYAQVYVRPLPYADADRIAMIWSVNMARSAAFIGSSFEDIHDVSARSRTFDSFASFAIDQAIVRIDGPAERLTGATVTPNYFDVLGVRPLFGRIWSTPDDREQGLVVSYDFWNTRLATSATAVGRSITLSGRSYVILGVMPKTFRHPEPFYDESTYYWRQFRADEAGDGRGDRRLRTIGRLRTEASLASASADVGRIGKQLASEFMASNSKIEFRVEGLRQQLYADIRDSVRLSSYLLVVLLLLCSFNIGQLQLGRILERDSEIALRRMIGARRLQIIRLVLVETSLLLVAGCLLGVWLGDAVSDVTSTAIPRHVLESLGASTIDRNVIIFVIGLALAFEVLCGLVWSARLSPPTSGARRRTERGRARYWLVGAQFAVSMPLLLLAWLLTSNIWDLSRRPVGFEPDNLLTFRVGLPQSRYKTTASIMGAMAEFKENVGSLPGVQGASFGFALPLDSVNAQQFKSVTTREGETTRVSYRIVDPDFFNVIGAAISAGAIDPKTSQMSGVVVNEECAKLLWPGKQAVGQQLKILNADGTAADVSVEATVKDVRFGGLAMAITPDLFVFYARDPKPGAAFVVRTLVPPDSLVPEVRSAVARVDADLPVTSVRAMRSVLEVQRARPLVASLAGMFLGLVGLLLAVVGVVASVESICEARRAEFQIRLALGATTRRIANRLSARMVGVSILGIVAGVSASVVGTRFFDATTVNTGAASSGPIVIIALGMLVVAGLVAMAATSRLHRLDTHNLLRVDVRN